MTIMQLSHYGCAPNELIDHFIQADLDCDYSLESIGSCFFYYYYKFTLFIHFIEVNA